MEKNLKKLLVVTGSNKGVGFGIIESLVKQKKMDFNILLCSRNLKNGEEALKNLEENCDETIPYVKVAELDITDYKSIPKFVDLIKKDYNSKITCLINNAGVKGEGYNIECFDYTFGTNFFSTINFTKELLNNNLIIESGKIIFIGSSKGKLYRIKSDLIREKFQSKDLNETSLINLSSEFRLSIKNNSAETNGWPDSIYVASKIFINKYAYILGHSIDVIKRNIQVYACCPGWVKTDMGGPDGLKTPEEGSVTPLYLVNLKNEVNEELQGQFFIDKKISEL